MPGRRRRILVMAAITVAAEAALLHARSGRLAGDVVVRCGRGHLFTTLWIPGASVKSVRLGFWRLQRCPVGPHWTIVTPVREAELSSDELTLAHDRHDLRVP